MRLLLARKPCYDTGARLHISLIVWRDRKEVSYMPDGETGGFLERLRNSPRTVSTIIVVLIVVGAIFAFSDRGNQPVSSPTPGGTETPATEASPTPEGEATPVPGAADDVKDQEAPATPEPTPSPLPEAQETDAAYIEVAGKGDGVTHLARRAMLRNLGASAPDFEVTAEHKVWIEDYLKDRLGSKSLAIGENRTIEKNLVREAVQKSKELTDAQRKHLQRYSRLVAAYR